jgi:hypothetical protein
MGFKVTVYIHQILLFPHHQPINVPIAGIHAFLMDYAYGERAITLHDTIVSSAHSKYVFYIYLGVNPLTAVTSLGVKDFRLFNAIINIKDFI